MVTLFKGEGGRGTSILCEGLVEKEDEEEEGANLRGK